MEQSSFGYYVEKPNISYDSYMTCINTNRHRVINNIGESNYKKYLSMLSTIGKATEYRTKFSMDDGKCKIFFVEEVLPQYKNLLLNRQTVIDMITEEHQKEEKKDFFLISMNTHYEVTRAECTYIHWVNKKGLEPGFRFNLVRLQSDGKLVLTNHILKFLKWKAYQCTDECYLMLETEEEVIEFFKQNSFHWWDVNGFQVYYYW